MIWLKRILYFFCVRCRPGRAKTVYYTFSAIWFIAGIALVASVVSSTASEVSIVSSVNTIEEGRPFKIDVYANAAVPVNAINIAVSFPEDKVELKEIDTGPSVITIWTTEPYEENGTVFLQGGTFRRGFLGRHLIASLDFEAKVSGPAQFALNDATFLAGDGSGDEVKVQNKQDTITVAVATVDGVLSGELGVLIRTDLDGDGLVSLGDVRSFMSQWGRGRSEHDFNQDNQVNFTDFAIILADSFRY